MNVEPWMIEQLEEERRRREEEAAQRVRIELPQTAPAGEREKTGPGGRVMIVDISPPDEHVVDV